MMQATTTDVVIFGGGIAGLWLLQRLRQAGYAAMLFETKALGSGQTICSQGIIHGGMKYALQGRLTNDAKAMADMPTLWKQCLAGNGEIDLSRVPILSPRHYLWSTNKLTAKLTGFLAGAALTSKVATLPKEQYPTIFQARGFKGEVYALDEMVIDVPSLLRELAHPYRDAIFHIDAMTKADFHFDETGTLQSATVRAADRTMQVQAQQFIFTAGAGNQAIIDALPQQAVTMQRRPLHMVLAKTPFNYPLYAHCFGLGARPRITVTTHYCDDGRAIWYLGGLLSEEGVARDEAQQIKAARQELGALFPWIDLTHVEFATFRIDRAEPRQEHGLKPETSFNRQIKNMIIAWPTKLALAPKLAGDIMQQLQLATIKPTPADHEALSSWPRAAIAMPPWEELFCKNVA